SSLQKTWEEFLLALHAPSSEEFRPFYWIYRLSRALLTYIFFQSKLRRVIPWLRPLIPFFGITLAAICILAYFTTFRRTIVLQQWCSCNTDDTTCNSCYWDVMHTSLVLFLAVNILGNYVSSTFRSPGFVVNMPHNNTSECEDEGKDEVRFGGCCF
ncbi:hypothetical protein ACHAXH_001632, partial [Discostella pseudostelligera]